VEKLRRLASRISSANSAKSSASSAVKGFKDLNRGVRRDYSENAEIDFGYLSRGLQRAGSAALSGVEDNGPCALETRLRHSAEKETLHAMSLQKLRIQILLEN
jgi:hypothetical protein